MNTSHFLKLLCTSSSQCASGREQKDEKPHAASGAGQGATPHSLCCSPFSMPEISGIVPAGAEPGIKYSSVFLSIIQAVWCWRGEEQWGAGEGRCQPVLRGLGWKYKGMAPANETLHCIRPNSKYQGISLHGECYVFKALFNTI